MEHLAHFPRDVNHRCLQCGRCCDGPPGMSIREAISLLDDFPLAASIVSMQEGLTLPEADSLPSKAAMMTLERQKELGGLITEAETTDGRRITFVSTLSAVAYQPEGLRKCSALQADGRCGIYERRPNVCRYVPGQHLLRPEAQDLALEMFRLKHGKDCDWSSAAPPVIRDGRLVERSMRRSFESAEADDRNDAMIMHWLLEQGTVFGGNEGEGITFEDILETAVMSRSKDVRPPFVVLAAMLQDLEENGYDLASYSLPPVEEVAMRQARACISMMRDMESGRLPGDPDLADELRDYVGICGGFILGGV